jgi:hypothetical protein
MFLKTLSVGTWIWHIRFHWYLLGGLRDELYTQTRCSIYTQCPSNAYRYNVHSLACLGSVTQASQTQAKWFLGFSWFVRQHQPSPHPANLWGLTLTSLTLQLIWICLCLTQIFLRLVIGHYASQKFKTKQPCQNIWDISNELQSCGTQVFLSYSQTCARHLFIVH